MNPQELLAQIQLLIVSIILGHVFYWVSETNVHTDHLIATKNHKKPQNDEIDSCKAQRSHITPALFY